MDTLPFFIGGQDRSPGGTSVDQVINPTTGAVEALVPRATADEVAAAVEAASAALADWRVSPPGERSAALSTLADDVQERADEFAAVETLNVGMPSAFARATVDAAVDTLRFFAGAARVLEGPVAGEYVRGMTSLMRREPVGVIAQFVPWNVPLLMAVWKLAPALAAGNTVVMKPSQRTPLSLSHLTRQIARRFPAGAVNVVTGDHTTVGTTLATHPRVAMVALTGGVEAGRELAALAATSTKRLHLELGGKAPIIVCPDADVELAAGTIVRAGLDNSGQDCTAASRVLAADGVHDRLVDAMEERIRRVRVGDPADPATEMGPVISEERRDWLQGQIRGAVAEGAVLRAGGKSLDRPGSFLEPTLLANVPKGARVTEVELFGPVITVERCDDEWEALGRANGSDYALAAGIWTRSIDRALALAAGVEAGKVWVNEHHRDVTEMPHGGRKASGYGSDLSLIALEEYTTVKSVHVRFASATP